MHLVALVTHLPCKGSLRRTAKYILALPQNAFHYVTSRILS